MTAHGLESLNSGGKAKVTRFTVVTSAAEAKPDPEVISQALLSQRNMESWLALTNVATWLDLAEKKAAEQRH